MSVIEQIEQTDAPEWLTRAAAARQLGIPPKSVVRLAMTGALAVRQLPGLAPRYSAVDCARIAEQAVIPSRNASA